MFGDFGCYPAESIYSCLVKYRDKNSPGILEGGLQKIAHDKKMGIVYIWRITLTIRRFNDP